MQLQNSQLWDGIQIKVIEPHIRCALGNNTHVIRYFGMCKTCSKKWTANQQNNIPHTMCGAMSLIVGAHEDQCMHAPPEVAFDIFLNLEFPVSSF